MFVDKEFCPQIAGTWRGFLANSRQEHSGYFNVAGNRDNSTGALNNRGTNGNYWSSSPNSTNAYNLNFNSTNVNPANNNNRANGFTARCLKN